VDEFMSRPTDVLVSFMARQSGNSERDIRTVLLMGRIAMAMEILTVMHLIEDHSILASREETLSVLQTLLKEQELEDETALWYARLSEWRKPKFETGEDGDGYREVDVSSHAVRQRDLLLPDSTDAPPGSDQTTDPPSAS